MLRSSSRNMGRRWKTSVWWASGFWMLGVAWVYFSVLLRAASMVVGVDISRKLLGKARDEAKKCSDSYVLQADADHLPFCEGTFEAVFGFTVLQNMPKPKETLAELKRVTKPNGNVVVTGLKKAFPLNIFLDILEGSPLKLISFLDRENLNCYVAVLSSQ